MKSYRTYSTTHLQHLVVEPVQHTAEELLGVLLAALDLEDVRPEQGQYLVDDDRFQRRIGGNVRRFVLLGLVPRDLGAQRQGRKLRHQCGPEQRETVKIVPRTKNKSPNSHGIDERLGVFAVAGRRQRPDGAHQVVERRARDQRLQDRVDVAVVGAVDETARLDADAVVLDLVRVEEFWGRSGRRGWI